MWMSNDNEKTLQAGGFLNEQSGYQDRSNAQTSAIARDHDTGKPLKRAMTKRHLVMISLGGAIGTGLFRFGRCDFTGRAGGSYFIVFARWRDCLHGHALFWGSLRCICRCRVRLVNMPERTLAREQAT